MTFALRARGLQGSERQIRSTSVRALCGVIAPAILLAQVVPARMAHAQGSQLAAVRSDTELPAVTVEAPKPAVRRTPKKPAAHAAVAPRPAGHFLTLPNLTIDAANGRHR